MANIFGTDGIRGVVNQYPIDPQTMMRVGAAIGSHTVQYHQNNSVVICMDTRHSCEMLKSALITGLASSGVDSLICGINPTAAVSTFITMMGASAGIMISASHNPHNYNGIKVFNSVGAKISDEDELTISWAVTDPSSKVAILKVPPSLIGKTQYCSNASDQYISYVCSHFLNKPVEFLKVVLDCANGSAYNIAPKIFSKAGMDVICLNVSPNGFNINTSVGPSISDVIRENKAFIGFAFDGDADRLTVYDSCGEVIAADHIIGFLATMLKKTDRLKGSAVVGTKLSNCGLENYLTSIGLNFIRADVGEKQVYENMKLSGASLGGEPSGHIINTDISPISDAIVSGLYIVTLLTKYNIAAKDIRQLFHLYPQLSYNIKYDDKVEVNQAIIKSIQEYLQSTTKDCRFIIRKSGTEPVIRLLVESKDKDLAQEYMDRAIKEICNNTPIIIE